MAFGPFKCNHLKKNYYYYINLKEIESDTGMFCFFRKYWLRGLGLKSKYVFEKSKAFNGVGRVIHFSVGLFSRHEKASLEMVYFLSDANIFVCA